MSNPFAKPGSATGIQWSDHLGRLLLVEPHAVEASVPTSLGEREAVRADITVIDADGGPAEFSDVLIFPRVLISQTRAKIGERVLGRLGQGLAKPGQSAPWRLEDYTDADLKAGLAYLEKRKNASPFSAPAGQKEEQPPF